MPLSTVAEQPSEAQTAIRTAILRDSQTIGRLSRQLAMGQVRFADVARQLAEAAASLHELGLNATRRYNMSNEDVATLRRAGAEQGWLAAKNEGDEP